MKYIIDDEDLDRLEHYLGEHNYLAHGWIGNMKDNRQIEEITIGRINFYTHPNDDKIVLIKGVNK